MISPDQVDDWVREVKERPESAPTILHAMATRLSELDSWNAELLADNIALRSGQRVEEYEQRIAALEYQLELLKRQASEGSITTVQAASTPATLSLVFFQERGQALRLPVAWEALAHGSQLARFTTPFDPDQPPPGLVACGPAEELLFIFDSGRTITLAVEELPEAGSTLDWRQGRRVAPRPGEELCAVLPIGRLALYDYCVQVSRRGCAKLMQKSSFQSFIARNSIGAGVKRRPDRTAGLALCARDGQLALATREGYLLAMAVDRLPYTVENVLQLGATDSIVSVFSPERQAHLLVLTNNGKAIHRELSWLEPAASYKSRGQAAFSATRRESGVRVAAAAVVDDQDWGVVLHADGGLTALLMADLLAAGTVGGESDSPLIGFVLLGAAG
jgi:DNA gyrase/topoisomerase IV subunit A